MEAEKIIKEKEIVHEDEHKDYASKGVGNAGLTLGIIGTALGAWAVSRNRGGLFGGGVPPPDRAKVPALTVVVPV